VDVGLAAMALAPNGGEDESGTWTPTDSNDGLNDSSPSAPQDSWSIGGPNHPTFCFFKGAADGLAGGLMGSVFGFGNILSQFESSVWSFGDAWPCIVFFEVVIVRYG